MKTLNEILRLTCWVYCSFHEIVNTVVVLGYKIVIHLLPEAMVSDGIIH